MINFITDSWIRIKNHCRTTVNKEFTDKEPTKEFKKKLLISEHSPIRLLEVDWTWDKVKYWCSQEWARHKFEKFISSQRSDRLNDGLNRDDKPQGALVKYDGYANAQNLIDSWRKRLCFNATPEARELAEDFKVELREKEEELSDVLVPNCVYRAGCPEINSKCLFWSKFLKYCKCNNLEIDTIQKRYDAYNEYFYKQRR